MEDNTVRNFLIGSGIVFGLFLTFILTVVVPANNKVSDLHWACIDKGGVWVQESRACLDPNKVLMK
jgi:hypothetical protein